MSVRGRHNVDRTQALLRWALGDSRRGGPQPLQLSTETHTKTETRAMRSLARFAFVTREASHQGTDSAVDLFPKDVPRPPEFDAVCVTGAIGSDSAVALRRYLATDEGSQRVLGATAEDVLELACRAKARACFAVLLQLHSANELRHRDWGRCVELCIIGGNEWALKRIGAAVGLALGPPSTLATPDGTPRDAALSNDGALTPVESTLDGLPGSRSVGIAGVRALLAPYRHDVGTHLRASLLHATATGITAYLSRWLPLWGAAVGTSTVLELFVHAAATVCRSDVLSQWLSVPPLSNGLLPSAPEPPDDAAGVAESLDSALGAVVARARPLPCAQLLLRAGANPWTPATVIAALGQSNVSAVHVAVFYDRQVELRAMLAHSAARRPAAFVAASLGHPCLDGLGDEPTRSSAVNVARIMGRRECVAMLLDHAVDRAAAPPPPEWS